VMINEAGRKVRRQVCLLNSERIVGISLT